MFVIILQSILSHRGSLFEFILDLLENWLHLTLTSVSIWASLFWSESTKVCHCIDAFLDELIFSSLEMSSVILAKLCCKMTDFAAAKGECQEYSKCIKTHKQKLHFYIFHTPIAAVFFFLNNINNKKKNTSLMILSVTHILPLDDNTRLAILYL